MLLFCAFLVGIVAGLRALLAPAGVSWAARLGVLGVTSTPLAFMGYKYTPVIFTVLAVGELINDKLPKTPSRKALPSFIARIVSGGLAGGTIGASREMLVLGLVAGALGAVVGTLGWRRGPGETRRAPRQGSPRRVAGRPSCDPDPCMRFALARLRDPGYGIVMESAEKAITCLDRPWLAKTGRDHTRPARNPCQGSDYTNENCYIVGFTRILLDSRACENPGVV